MVQSHTSDCGTHFSSHANNHVLEFLQEDIPPATSDPSDHNTLTNLWAQKTFTEEELSTLLESSLDIEKESNETTQCYQ